MINLTALRRLREAATKGPWKLSTTLYNDRVETSICGIGNREVAVCDEMDEEDNANAALIALAPDLAAAVLAHPAALRAAMIRGYEIALEEAARNGIGLPRADKCAALLDILTEYPDAH